MDLRTNATPFCFVRPAPGGQSPVRFVGEDRFLCCDDLYDELAANLARADDGERPINCVTDMYTELCSLLLFGHSVL
jgi:hypothetical protein